MFVRLDMVSSPHQNEPRVSATSTRREPFTVDARYFVFLRMFRIVYDFVDTRLLASVAGFKNVPNIGGHGYASIEKIVFCWGCLTVQTTINP